MYFRIKDVKKVKYTFFLVLHNLDLRICEKVCLGAWKSEDLCWYKTSSARNQDILPLASGETILDSLKS